MENNRVTREEIKAELERVNKKQKYYKVIRGTVAILITVAAIAILVATLWMPVIEIYGDSMTPTLNEGDIVACVKKDSYKTGDIIAFYYNNKLLVKRVICSAGDWFDMDYSGRVYVNGSFVEEDYLNEYAYGETNIRLPYQVPENKVFVLGDHRSVSIDSRNSAIGCIELDQIVGKLSVKIWPLGDFKIK